MADILSPTEGVNTSIEDTDRSREHDCDSDDLSAQSSDGDNAYPRENSDGDDRKRKKRRRGKHKGGKHHRKWRPYTTLTWSERQEVDAREAIRANQKREEAFASGHPVAPYNTTQFLIEDHIKSEVSPYLDQESEEAEPCVDSKPAAGPSTVPIVLPRDKTAEDEPMVSAPTSVLQQFDDVIYDSGTATSVTGDDEEERFLAKEFTSTYESIHLERLQSMSKEELVKENLELEKKVERMERLLSQRKDAGAVVVREADRESSDANSLGSSSEEFMDLSLKTGDSVSEGSSNTQVPDVLGLSKASDEDIGGIVTSVKT